MNTLREYDTSSPCTSSRRRAAARTKEVKSDTSMREKASSVVSVASLERSFRNASILELMNEPSPHCTGPERHKLAPRQSQRPVPGKHASAFSSAERRTLADRPVCRCRVATQAVAALEQ